MLSALDIYKLLPKTNCRKCGSNTCLAFAMQLATGKASASACADMASESRESLESQTRPPIAEVKIGNSIVGGETVLYRHEKKFFNPCLFCIVIGTDGEWEEEMKKALEFRLSRAGQNMRVDMVCMKGSGERLIDAVKRFPDDGRALMLDTDYGTLEEALPIVAARRPLVVANGENADLARKHGCPVLVDGVGMEDADSVLTAPRCSRDMLHFLTNARRLAIKRDKAYGHPVLAFADSVADAAMAVVKYASIVAMPPSMMQSMEPLMALRQAIYSDPQKPLQIKPGLYEINSPGRDAAVIATTNFSLTYYTVSTDIEASRRGAYLLVVDTEGQSVLTSFASEKLTAKKIADAVRESGVMDKVERKELIIPGLVPGLKGELEEMIESRVILGPRNSSKLKTFLTEGR